MRIILIIFLLQIKLANAEAGKDLRAQMGFPQAIAQTQQAILAYPYVKSKVKQLERKLIHYIPLEREYVVMTGSVGMAIIRGRLETRPIKNLEVDFMGGRARPDVFYNFRGEDKGAYFNITWGF
jgi:hypothetical protein